MLAKNSKVLTKKQSTSSSHNNHHHHHHHHQQNAVPVTNDVVELFSTDSEMDSFFKENELIVNNATYIFSSNSSPKTDDSNTVNEDFDDDEFDRIVSEAQRWVFLKKYPPFK